jgi:hydrogenase maturation protease
VVRDDGVVHVERALGRTGRAARELDTTAPVVLVDVVRTGAPPGALVELPLDAILDRALASCPTSSHGFGPAEVLTLARSLARVLPRGVFLGVEGARFDPFAPFTEGVEIAIPALAAAIRRVAGTLGGDESAISRCRCTA